MWGDPKTRDILLLGFKLEKILGQRDSNFRSLYGKDPDLKRSYIQVIYERGCWARKILSPGLMGECVSRCLTGEDPVSEKCYFQVSNERRSYVWKFDFQILKVRRSWTRERLTFKVSNWRKSWVRESLWVSNRRISWPTEIIFSGLKREEILGKKKSISKDLEKKDLMLKRFYLQVFKPYCLKGNNNIKLILECSALPNYNSY